MLHLLDDWGWSPFIALTGGLLWLSSRHPKTYATIFRRFIKIIGAVCAVGFLGSVLIVILGYSEINDALREAAANSFFARRVLRRMHLFGISAIIGVVGFLYLGIIWGIGSIFKVDNEDASG